MKKERIRFLIVLSVLFLSIYIVLPTFIPQDAPHWLKRILAEKKVRLGLDLKGGTYLVLGVDMDLVLKENRDRYVSFLNERFKSEKLKAKATSYDDSVDKIIVKFPPEEKDKVSKIIAKQQAFKLVSSQNDNIVVGFTDKMVSYFKQKALDQTIEAIRNRIDEFGVSEPSIMAQGEDRVVVQLPGIKDTARAKAIIGRTAKLEFKLVVDDPKYNQAYLMKLVKEAESKGIKYVPGKSYFKYVEEFNKFIKGKIPKDTVVYFQKKVYPNKKVELIPYLLQKETLVTGEHLADAWVSINQQTQDYEVDFRMNELGAKLFAELTGNNIGKRLAIVLDKNVYSAPVIRDRIAYSGRISLDSSKPLQEMQQEANDLALVLRAGALPTQMTFEEERTVGPTLGSDSVRQGAIAMFWAFVLVFVFMILYYRWAGFVADIALLLNVLIITSILILFDAVLTLPGIAGIILTVGMSVDANVIIFERIREELRRGAGVKVALETGYSKAFTTILDANITTAIAGFVLLQYGTGPIKGFAVTLLIGIVSSVWTAVYVSRWIFEWYLNTFNVKKLSI